MDRQPADCDIQVELVPLRTAFETLKSVSPQIGRERTAVWRRGTMYGARPAHLVARFLRGEEANDLQHLGYSDRRTYCLKVEAVYLLFRLLQLTTWSHNREEEPVILDSNRCPGELTLCDLKATPHVTASLLPSTFDFPVISENRHRAATRCSWAPGQSHPR